MTHKEVKFTGRRAACWRLKATLLHLVDLFVKVIVSPPRSEGEDHEK
jgi:hypothetical protein